MRKLIIALAAIATLVVAGPAGAATTTTVRIYGSTFSPRTVTITAGDTITWTNRDNAPHQVLATKGQFVSPILRQNQSFSFTFHAAGTYAYKDELHPKLTAKVVVKGLPPTVTLTASLSILTYGTKATLSGVVSSHKAGEPVTIYYQPYPQPNLIQRATLLTSEGGNYSFIVAPQIATNYQVAWKGRLRDPHVDSGRAEAESRPEQRVDHPRLRRALVRRAGRAVPAAERRDQSVGHAQEGAPERSLVGKGALRAAEGRQPPAVDDVGQPGRRRLPRRDRPDDYLAHDLTVSGHAADPLPVRCLVPATPTSSQLTTSHQAAR